MNRKQEKAMWASNGRGFGRRYGWKLPNGHFVSLGKSKITMPSVGGVSVDNMGYPNKILNLKTGIIEKESNMNKCSWCGDKYQKGSKHGCGKFEITGC